MDLPCECGDIMADICNIQASLGFHTQRHKGLEDDMAKPAQDQQLMLLGTSTGQVRHAAVVLFWHGCTTTYTHHPAC